ncbi:MAG: SOS response-associated peptidase [Bacteroidales bacterium]|nr:SOS response-associated peptidase [Bacteroidales bacterium]
MCYTIECYLSRKAIEDRFALDTSALFDFDFRYFFKAFSNPFLPVVTQDEPDRLRLMQWGLIPNWVKNFPMAQKIRSATYNARSETVHEKASFRQSFRNRRCWVIAHGFFEWQDSGGIKIPWYIKLKNDHPFALAGLYDTWIDSLTGEQLSTFSVITTRANPMLEKIHNTKKRMPVILNPLLEQEWLDNDTEPSKLFRLMAPYPEDKLTSHPVSRELIRGDRNPYDSNLIKPVQHPESGLLFD